MTIFQSTCPARGTTIKSLNKPYLEYLFQSTCPARGTTPFNSRRLPRGRISIHVPREGHDIATAAEAAGAKTYFNPRAPRGARLKALAVNGAVALFQSTCPARGTTTPLKNVFVSTSISIHVPREGHDSFSFCRVGAACDFNPRAPRGARLKLILKCGTIGRISIHVPREGHDCRPTITAPTSTNFNPRAPRGARQEYRLTAQIVKDFNPRAPRGARPIAKQKLAPHRLFQSTCPARGTTVSEP